MVEVSRGLFNVLLGSTTPLSASDFDGTSRWLELEVEGETLSPRVRIVSAPYAIQAEEAKNAWSLTGNVGHHPDAAPASLSGNLFLSGLLLRHQQVKV